MACSDTLPRGINSKQMYRVVLVLRILAAEGGRSDAR